MNRNRKEEEYKAYLKRVTEWNENWQAQIALGYKELDKPIHYGYEVYYELRDDISRRTDVSTIQTLIDEYIIPMWCENPDGTSYRRNYKRRKGGQMEEVKPHIRYIPTYRWDRVRPEVKDWFELKESHHSWGVSYYHYALTIPNFWLVKKVRKYYKTHYKVIDEVLKQEEAEIYGDLWGKYYDYWVGGNYWSKDWVRYTNKAARRHNKQLLRDVIKGEFHVEGYYANNEDGSYPDEYMNFINNTKKWR